MQEAILLLSRAMICPGFSDRSYADVLAIQREKVQLRSDEIVGNRTAIEADRHALSSEEAKLRVDLATLRAAIAAVPF